MRINGKVILFYGLMAAGASLAQQPSANAPVIENTVNGKWVHDKGDPPGSDGIMLRMDQKSGAMEFFARYPAGYVFPPHWHESNERMLLLEGRMSLKSGDVQKTLEPGGFAFLPAKQMQHLACVSDTRCVFYLAWDGKAATHKGPVE